VPVTGNDSEENQKGAGNGLVVRVQHVPEGGGEENGELEEQAEEGAVSV
jgi:hypothetical protein